MLFEFLHNSTKCYGLINENLLNETFKIYILDCNHELGYELIFISKESKEWDTSFSIKNAYPLTYNNICKKLEEIFSGSRFSKGYISPSSGQNFNDHNSQLAVA